MAGYLSNILLMFSEIGIFVISIYHISLYIIYIITLY